MSKNYGIPYKGSKNSIAEWVLDNLPPAETLYDLFGGGGAITHAALESGKYNNVVYNELNKPIAQMFCNAVHGLYKDRTEWISREDFKALKDIDPFVATIWSFGNGLRTYMYSEEIEPWKKALHYAIVFEDYSLVKKMGINFTLIGLDTHTRRLEARQIIHQNSKEYITKYIEWYKKNEDNIENITKITDNLWRLVNLERLERLQSLESLGYLKNDITIYAEDYRAIPIASNSVIYCDIPYKNTERYVNQTFDYKAFYDWCCKQEVPVYISEYTLDDDRFEIVAEKEKRVLYSSQSNSITKTEKLFKVKGR